MLTKKSFALVASTLVEAGKAAKLSEQQKTIVVERFVLALAKTNPNFDVEKFRKACL